jgi:hypothetical protein
VVTRIGTGGVVAVFAAGVWLIAAPFALGYHHPGAGWSETARTDVITGAVLAVAGFTGIFCVIAGRVGELYADARSAASLASPGYPGADRRNSPR